MSEELVFWGSVFSIIGVCVTGFLTIYVIKLGKKQREIDEQYYRHQTLTNIRSISQNIINVLTISTGEDTRTKEEFENNTIELKRFFKNNGNTMRLLIQDSKFTLSKWISLEQNERKEIQYIIDSLQWILDTYFPDKENSDELQQRIWTTHYDELENRKNIIVQTVESITIRYSQ